MTLLSRNENGLLEIINPKDLRILFLAPYAPDAPDYGKCEYDGDGGYADYYYNILQTLKCLGFVVDSSSKPYTIAHSSGISDYVFSLYNRMPMHNSEVFISAYCEYLCIPYLGAAPNVRCLAEDKYLSKLAAAMLGIPTPNGKAYTRNHHAILPPEFAGPYFIKDRFGAGSEGIDENCLQDTWEGAKGIIYAYWEEGKDVLVEQFVDGIDITASILGDEAPLFLGLIHPKSDKKHSILTEDLKLYDHLGYETFDAGNHRAVFESDARAIWESFGPIDYFRMDYRYDPRTGARWFIEFNVCCYLGRGGAIALSGYEQGFEYEKILNHIVGYSLQRQVGLRDNAQRIL